MRRASLRKRRGVLRPRSFFQHPDGPPAADSEQRRLRLPSSARTTHAMPGGNKHGASHAVFAADASSQTSPAAPAHERCTDADMEPSSMRQKRTPDPLSPYSASALHCARAMLPLAPTLACTYMATLGARGTRHERTFDGQ